MIGVIPHNGQHIEQPGLDRVDPLCIFRQPRCEVGESLMLERGIDNDASAVAERTAKGGDELAPGVAGICGKKLVMLWRRTRFLLDTHAPLEGQLVVRTHPCKAWDRRVD